MSRIFRFTVVVVAVLTLSAQPQAQVPALGELAALPLAAALNKIADRVDVSVEKAGTVANGVLIRAGSEVNAQIDNLRVAYADMLNQTVQTLLPAVQNQIAQVASDAAALENKTAADAARIATLAQQTANILPLSNKRPQVARVEPSYEVYSSDPAAPPIQITVDGNFVDAADVGFTPTVRVDDQVVQPIHLTTQHLMFAVPRSVLRIAQNKATSYVRLQLVTPYKERSLLRTHRREATFRLLLNGIPASPGKVTVDTRVPFTTTTRRHVGTPQYNLQSDRDDHVQEICGPNETGTIDPNSVRLAFEHIEGTTWTQRPTRVNNPSVCYWFRTEHHGLGTSDKLWWHYEYDVIDTVTGINQNTQALNLGWGDSQVIPVSAGQFTVTFDGFDGSHQQFSAANHDNRFIVVATEGNALRISARPVTGILAQ
jgi:hypothetical protein